MPAAALRTLSGPRWPSMRGDAFFPEEEAAKDKLLVIAPTSLLFATTGSAVLGAKHRQPRTQMGAWWLASCPIRVSQGRHTATPTQCRQTDLARDVLLMPGPPSRWDRAMHSSRQGRAF